MELREQVKIAAGQDEVWALLEDVPRVVPCIPGAELTGTLGPSSWQAEVQVSLGPVRLRFDSKVDRRELDPAGRRMTLDLSAQEVRGRGSAQAVMESVVEDAGSEPGSVLTLRTDLTLAGPLAQYGQGLVRDVGAQLAREFGANLQAELGSDGGGAAQTAPAKKPGVSGLALLWRVVVRRIKTVLRRAFGRGKTGENHE